MVRETWEALREEARPLAELGSGAWSGLLERMAGAHFVLLGGCTHGTHEFDRARAALTRRLVERGFRTVLIEAEPAPVERVERYVSGQSGDATATEALRDLAGFPAWVWRNVATRDFLEWLTEHNASAPGASIAGMDARGPSLRGDADPAARASAWNRREEAMAEAVDAHGRRGQVVVWGHAAHLGDARAADELEVQRLSLGQLVRERHPGETFLLGFTTFQGTFSAAQGWNLPVERQPLPAVDGESLEALLHGVGSPRFWLSLHAGAAAELLEESRWQRLLGVVHRLGVDRGAWVARAALQFDALVFFDRTHALRPLDAAPVRREVARSAEPPALYPSGM